MKSEQLLGALMERLRDRLPPGRLLWANNPRLAIVRRPDPRPPGPAIGRKRRSRRARGRRIEWESQAIGRVDRVWFDAGRVGVTMQVRQEWLRLVGALPRELSAEIPAPGQPEP